MRGPTRGGGDVRGGARAAAPVDDQRAAEGALRSNPHRAEAENLSSLPAAIEAILFSSSRPLTLRELQHATDSDRTAVEKALDDLRETLEGRGVMLKRHHDVLHLATPPDLPTTERLARPPAAQSPARAPTNQ